MALQCNIDRKGRMARALIGVLCLASGIALLWTRPLGPPWLSVGAGVVLAAAGALGLFEARKGWCALRAAGIRTPF